jgi:ferritin-like protein
MWKYRNDTPQQRKVRIERARQDLLIAIDLVKSEFCNEPANKELCDIFNNLDAMTEDLSKE